MKKPTNNNIHELILIMRDSSNDISLTDCYTTTPSLANRFHLLNVVTTEKSTNR